MSLLSAWRNGGKADKEVRKRSDAMKFEKAKVITNKPLRHAHENDAGFDIESAEDVILAAKEFTQKIHTNLHVDIPAGYFGLVKERSGMASKGIFVMGGVIDSGYHGEIMINLANMSVKDYKINAGDRIAQLIIIPCAAYMVQGEPEKVLSERGANGFGSSGK